VPRQEQDQAAVAGFVPCLGSAHETDKIVR
jgi:hypothetical protein